MIKDELDNPVKPYRTPNSVSESDSARGLLSMKRVWFGILAALLVAGIAVAMFSTQTVREFGESRAGPPRDRIRSDEYASDTALNEPPRDAMDEADRP